MRFAVAALVAAMTIPAAHAWDHQSAVSPVDDATVPSIHKDAVAEYITDRGKQGRAQLQILCEQKRTVLAIVVPELYVSDSGAWGTVTLRVDKKPASKAKFVAANNHGSLALIGAPAIRISKSLSGGRSLFARILPVNEPSVDLSFDISGIDDAIQPIRTACGW